MSRDEYKHRAHRQKFNYGAENAGSDENATEHQKEAKHEEKESATEELKEVKAENKDNNGNVEKSAIIVGKRS